MSTPRGLLWFYGGAVSYERGTPILETLGSDTSKREATHSEARKWVGFEMVPETSNCTSENRNSKPCEHFMQRARLDLTLIPIPETRNLAPVTRNPNTKVSYHLNSRGGQRDQACTT